MSRQVRPAAATSYRYGVAETLPSRSSPGAATIALWVAFALSVYAVTVAGVLALDHPMSWQHYDECFAGRSYFRPL